MKQEDFYLGVLQRMATQEEATRNLGTRIGELRNDIGQLGEKGCMKGAMHDEAIGQLKKESTDQYHKIRNLASRVNGPNKQAALISGGVTAGTGMLVVALTKLNAIIEFFKGLGQ